MNHLINILTGGLLETTKLEEFCFNLFFEKEGKIIKPNKKLFKFLKIADNLHDFKLPLEKDENQIKPLGNEESIKIPKEDYEKKLFITVYTLIRLWGKIKFDDNKSFNNTMCKSKN